MIWIGALTSCLHQHSKKGPNLFVPAAPKEEELRLWKQIDESLSMFDDSERKIRAQTVNSKKLAATLLQMLDDVDVSKQLEEIEREI